MPLYRNISGFRNVGLLQLADLNEALNDGGYGSGTYNSPSGYSDVSFTPIQPAVQADLPTLQPIEPAPIEPAVQVQPPVLPVFNPLPPGTLPTGVLPKPTPGALTPISTTPATTASKIDWIPLLIMGGIVYTSVFHPKYSKWLVVGGVGYLYYRLKKGTA